MTNSFVTTRKVRKAVGCMYIKSAKNCKGREEVHVYPSHIPCAHDISFDHYEQERLLSSVFACVEYSPPCGEKKTANRLKIFT